MDLYKIVHFNHESNGVAFPWFYALGEAEGRQLRQEFGAKLGAENPNPTDPEIYSLLRLHRAPVTDVNANDADFCLSRVLKKSGIHSLQYVYLDWAEDEDRFGATLDEMKFAEFDAAFHMIWYPELDDLLLFDDSYEWACEITLTGAVNVALIRGQSSAGEEKPALTDETLIS